MNSAHRQASHAKRAPHLLPKFWLKPLAASTQSTLAIVHWDNLTAMTNGQAGTDILWDWIACGYTYQRMAQLLAEEGVDITPDAHATLAEQLETHEAILARFRRTSRVGFDAEQYRIAKAACHVMDALATLDRNGCATRASFWSEAQVRRAQARFEGCQA